MAEALLEIRSGRAVDIRAEASERKIYLYDAIWDSARRFADMLDSFGGADVDLHVNSPGGDVFEAQAMRANMENYAGSIEVHIDGLCASAATTVALGGSSIEIAPGGMFMIHNAWTLEIGTADDMEASAEVLRKIDGALRKDYAARTGMNIERVKAMMAAETWLSAEESVELGFCDELAEAKGAKDKDDVARAEIAAYHRKRMERRAAYAFMLNLGI